MHLSLKNDPAHGVPYLLPQPTEGDTITALELVNRYGTYEIQPTSDSENFFPAIAAGTYNSDRLHQLRMQTIIGTRGFAHPDIKEDKKG